MLYAGGREEHQKNFNATLFLVNTPQIQYGLLSDALGFGDTGSLFSSLASVSLLRTSQLRPLNDSSWLQTHLAHEFDVSFSFTLTRLKT